jgi:hypothetical protein
VVLVQVLRTIIQQRHVPYISSAGLLPTYVPHPILPAKPLENPEELYVDKTQTAKVVLKSIWCSFYLKVHQRRAHDES